MVFPSAIFHLDDSMTSTHSKIAANINLLINCSHFIWYTHIHKHMHTRTDACVMDIALNHILITYVQFLECFAQLKHELGATSIQ